MDEDQVAIARLVRIPIEFRSRGDISVKALAEELQLEELVTLGAIYPRAIQAHLQADRSLIEVWLEWSADQRCADGGYFIKTDEEFVVASRLNAMRVRYAEPTQACAAFIYSEVKSWLR